MNCVADYGDPRSALLGLVVAAFAIGGFIASPFVPLVADKLGRRYSMLFGSMVSIIGGILQGSAVHRKWLVCRTPNVRKLDYLIVSMFIVARFISGIGLVFSLVAALALVGGMA